MTLTMTLTQADVVAALQAWVTLQGHQMNAVVAPIYTGNGSIIVQLNN
jgi:hypothetical protein